MKKLKQMWVTPEFRQFMYSEKAKNPDKTFKEILNEIVEKKLNKKKKDGNFFGKL